jgi:hypothetical protein
MNIVLENRELQNCIREVERYCRNAERKARLRMWVRRFFQGIGSLV